MGAQRDTPFQLRPAREADMPSVAAILSHYIENTVVNLAYTAPSEEEIVLKWKSVQSESLPYIVATDVDDRIVGYSYATGFRAPREGYGHTVEMSLFCHPKYTTKGIGTQLLKTLISVLSAPEDFPDYVPHPRSADKKVRMVIACMSVDDSSWKSGLGLKEYYERFGFEQVGRMNKVGHKFGRWIDTIYLQLALW